MSVDFSRVTPVTNTACQDKAETGDLLAMLNCAETYLKSFDWCPGVAERYLGYWLEGVIAVFLFELEAKIHDTDDLIWVVVGDVPSAYLVCDNASEPASALAVYCEMMEDWARAVLSISRLDEVFPVAAEPTPSHANMLLSRTKFIREELIPLIKKS
ncbi:MAG: hypothetical protein IT364_18990 [Candidatus Hydrogenedentes bacterium]|nr:hypothetical protein [Candidatus Hydrogenedentota bacterium]